MSLALNTKHLSSFINEEEYKAIYPQVEAAHKTLEAKNGPGSDFLGWMYLPRDYDKEEFERIKAAAAKIREDSDVLVVAGIGGSYSGDSSKITITGGTITANGTGESPAIGGGSVSISNADAPLDITATAPDAANAIQSNDGKTLDKVISLMENGKKGLVKLVAVSYTHLTLPTNSLV